MEGKLRNSISGTRGFKDAIDSSVIDSGNQCKEIVVSNISDIDSNTAKIGCNPLRTAPVLLRLLPRSGSRFCQRLALLHAQPPVETTPL